MNEREREARAVARSLADQTYAALLKSGVDRGSAAETAGMVYEQEYRFELMDSYGETEATLREDLETFARCLEDDEEEPDEG
jgi:hypothetical protein